MGQAGVRVRRCGRLAERGDPGAVVVGRPLGPVVLDRDAVDRPASGWVAGVTDGEVEVVGAGEITAAYVVGRVILGKWLDGRDVREPAVRLLVEIAALVCD